MPLRDEAFSFAIAQPLDDFRRPADDFLNGLTETDIEDKEEAGVIGAAEDHFFVDHANLAESDEDSERASGLILYLHEITRIPLLTAKEEIRLALLVQQGKLEQQQAIEDNTRPNDKVMQQSQEAQR